MSDVIEILNRPCEGTPCKLDSRVITKETGSVVVNDKTYHPECQPSQMVAQRRGYFGASRGRGACSSASRKAENAR